MLAMMDTGLSQICIGVIYIALLVICVLYAIPRLAQENDFGDVEFIKMNKNLACFYDGYKYLYNRHYINMLGVQVNYFACINK